jgi:hypothetical protein
MSISITTILISGAFFLLIFWTGFGLRRAGQPYPVPSVTTHKFLSLGLAAYLIVSLYPVDWTDGAGRLALAAAIASGLLLMAAIITGGLRSINKPMPLIVRALHWATPFLSVITTAGLFSLLMR